MLEKKFYSKINSVSLMPCWMFRIQGIFDSRKGASAAESRIIKLKDRCAAIENKECLITESKLFSTRTRAAEIVLSVASCHNSISKMSGTRPDASPASEYRRNKALKDIEKATVPQLEELSKIREKLINGNTVLEERIVKTRKKTLVKIDAYVSGLRSGSLSDFEPDVSFDDRASDIYHTNHKAIDEAVFKLSN